MENGGRVILLIISRSHAVIIVPVIGSSKKMAIGLVMTCKARHKRRF